MDEILNRIDEYINVKERNDAIASSLHECEDLDVAIDLFKNSNDKENTISSFSEKVRRKIEELINGGIL